MEAITFALFFNSLSTAWISSILFERIDRSTPRGERPPLSVMTSSSRHPSDELKSYHGF
jgi:hypothetical protein